MLLYLSWLLCGLFIGLLAFSISRNREAWRINHRVIKVADELAKECSTLKQVLENRNATIQVLVSNIRSGNRGLDELQTYFRAEESKLRERENRFRNTYKNSQN